MGHDASDSRISLWWWACGHSTLQFALHSVPMQLYPWSLVRFLDYAAERIFLRKIGGGFMFIHPMLMDYFASLYPQQEGNNASQHYSAETLGSAQ